MSRSQHNSPASNPELDAALQPAQPQRDQRGPHQPRVEPSVSGDLVARMQTPEGQAELSSQVATRMREPADLHRTTAWERVNAQDRTGATFQERSGYAALTAAASYEHPGGPTQQPGVRVDPAHNPSREPLGGAGVPGAGKERNVTDLDLAQNRHPEGDAFDDQAKTVGRPIAPGEPAPAKRSLPPTAGGPAAGQATPEHVPPGAVSRPEPARQSGNRPL